MKADETKYKTLKSNLYEHLSGLPIDLTNYRITLQIADELNRMPIEPIIIKDTGIGIEEIQKHLTSPTDKPFEFKIVDLPLPSINHDLLYEWTNRIESENRMKFGIVPAFRDLPKVEPIDFSKVKFPKIEPIDFSKIELPKLEISLDAFKFDKLKEITTELLYNFSKEEIHPIERYYRVRKQLHKERLFNLIGIHEGETYTALDGKDYKVMSIDRYSFNVYRIGGDSVQIIGKNSEFANSLCFCFDPSRTLKVIEHDITLTKNIISYLQSKLNNKDKFMERARPQAIENTRKMVIKQRKKLKKFKLELYLEQQCQF